MMDVLSPLLLRVSNTMLVPVVTLLFGLLGMCLVFAGGLAAEAVERRRNRSFRKLVERLCVSENRVRAGEVPARTGLPRYVFGFPVEAPHAAEKRMDDAQLLSERLLARLGFGIRLGPVLGLAGTLIPLGPALVSLSTGDIATLSSRLVVAFTTTVVGLLVGGTCHAMHTVRKSWYQQDLNDIEFVLSRLEKGA